MAIFRPRSTGFINPWISEALHDSFSEHEMAALSQLGTIVTIDGGQHLASQGAVGQEALVVLDGTADVIRNNEVIATVGPGSILGEIALLTGEPRNATLVALDELTISVLSRREFNSLLDQCPRLAIEIDKLVTMRLAA